MAECMHAAFLQGPLRKEMILVHNLHRMHAIVLDEEQKHLEMARNSLDDPKEESLTSEFGRRGVAFL